MADFSRTPNGIVLHSRYTYRGVRAFKDIFPNNEKTVRLLNKKKNARGDMKRKYNVDHYGALVRRVFMEFLIRVLDEVAEGHIFLFPGKRQSHIFLEETPQEELKHLRQMGKYKEFDIFSANFKLPRFAFRISPTTRRYKYQLHVPRRIKERAVRNAEERKITFQKLLKKI